MSLPVSLEIQNSLHRIKEMHTDVVEKRFIRKLSNTKLELEMSVNQEIFFLLKHVSN